MTNKTEEQIVAEAEAFIELVRTNAPDALGDMHIIRLCGGVMTDYSPDFENVKRLLLMLASMIYDYYEAEPHDECDCGICTEKRKAKAH